jgi:hypothetical protein
VRRGRAALSSQLIDLPLPFYTDHPGLQFTLTFELALDVVDAPPGPIRYRIGHLDKPEIAGLFRRTFDSVADIVETALSCAEGDCRDARTREDVMESIDAAESIFSTVVGVAGEDVLGLYEPQKARTRPDKDRERLEQCSDADSACRLWERMQRDTPFRPIVSSEPGRSAVEDVIEHWGRVVLTVSILLTRPFPA